MKMLHALNLVIATVLLVLVGNAAAYAGGTCFICKKSSTRACIEATFCKSASGTDTPDDRKRCREAGCDIGGSATCPATPDVKICLARKEESPWRSVAEAKTADGEQKTWGR